MQQPPYQYLQEPVSADVYQPQPGQTNVIVNPTPIAGAPQEEVCCSGTSTKFNLTGGVVTGIIQLIIAVLSIILGSVSITIYYYVHSGLWSGPLFFFLTGILGVVSKNRGTCVITGYLVMSILSTLQAFGMMCVEVSFFAISEVFDALNACGSSSCDTEGEVAIHAVLGVLAFIEFVVSIAGAAICCEGLRCCCASPSPTTTTTTTTSYAYGGNPNHGYVVQPAQPVQLGQLGKPAPYDINM